MKFSENLLKCILLYNNLKKFYIEGCFKNEESRDIMISILNRDMDFLRYNKVLVAMSEFLNKCYSYTNVILKQRIHRYKIYYEETNRIFHAFDEENVRAICFKTFTSIPKDVADVDILLYKYKDLEIAEKLLAKLGYKKRKKGLEQHLWTIVRDNVIVDIELHTNVAAASYTYYPKTVLFSRSKRQDSIVLPSPVDSILLLVAHAVIKDFYITLADLLDFELTIIRHRIDLNKLKSEAASLGLALPLQVFLSMLYPFNATNMYNRFNISKIFSIRKISGFPLRPNPYTVLLSYIYLTVKKLRNESLKSVLAQAISLPSGKGIDYFVKFMLFSKPPVKNFSE